MANTGLEAKVAAVRRFNRFYTRRIGVLGQGHLESPFTLTEVRVLYELAHAGAPVTASHIAEELGLDAGYLSRLLSQLTRRGLIQRRRSTSDARQWLLGLTATGRRAFASLDRKASGDVQRLLESLPGPEQERLVEALTAAESLLGGQRSAREPFLLRPPHPGDLGWIVQRHGELYAREYGWGPRFEGLVARVVADFLDHADPERERCWIAEKDGIRIGSVLLVRHTATVAKLRLLLVEPSARGLGVGRRLVQECEHFARQVGYRKIVLWTNRVLTAARGIYETEGYRRVKVERDTSFGRDPTFEVWERALRGEATGA